MIRRYLDKEIPLDSDVEEIKRVVRARSREEKKAVDVVLKEFFSLAADGWHHKTCDEIIFAFQAGEPEREAKKANEETRMRRHRDERAALFAQLTAAGQHAAWNIGIKELRAMVGALQPLKSPEPETPPVTAPATPATATQTPIPNHQYIKPCRRKSPTRRFQLVPWSISRKPGRIANTAQMTRSAPVGCSAGCWRTMPLQSSRTSTAGPMTCVCCESGTSALTRKSASFSNGPKGMRFGARTSSRRQSCEKSGINSR